MNVRRRIRIPCVIVNHTEDPDERDEYNNPSLVAGDPIDDKCWYRTEDPSETEGLTETETERWRFYFRPGTAVAAAATVTVNGDTYEIEGPPSAPPNPHRARPGRADWIEARAKRVT